MYVCVCVCECVNVLYILFTPITFDKLIKAKMFIRSSSDDVGGSEHDGKGGINSVAVDEVSVEVARAVVAEAVGTEGTGGKASTASGEGTTSAA